VELTSIPKRFRKRRDQRGAAVFVVALAIVLLSGLGAWAMQTARLVDQASGYGRSALQTQYVAELGVTAGTAFLSIPGWGATQYNAGRSRPDPCEATRGQIANRFCRNIQMSEINAATIAPLLDAGTATLPGSLGSFNAGDGAVQGVFNLEMTDPERAIVPGSDISKSQYYRVTLTSRGQVRPAPTAATDACLVGPNSMAGRIGLRAHTVVGPI